MDQIALLWVAISVLFLVVIFKPGRSGYAGFVAPNSLIDLQEFKGIPGELKQAYRDNVLNGLVPQVSDTVTKQWNNLKDSERKAALQQIKEATGKLSQQIQTQGMAHPMVQSAVGASTGPASGMSQIQKALSQCATDPVQAANWASQNGFVAVPFGNQCPTGLLSGPQNFNGFTLCGPNPPPQAPDNIKAMISNCK